MTYCEWVSLSNMAVMLVKCPKEMIAFFDRSAEAVTFGEALGRIEQAMPNVLTCHTSIAVLFDETEHDLLVRLADWFEALLIEHSESLMNKNLEGFKAQWNRVGRIKHHFYHAKYSDTETKNDAGDGSR